MPLFERQFVDPQQRSDSRSQGVSPERALLAVRPTPQVIVTPTKQHTDGLVERGETPPSPAQGLALIDTGAAVTAVDEEVCKKLGLKPTGLRPTAHAGGSETRACYPIQIVFPGAPFPPFTSPVTMSVNLQFGKTPYILLFGRDLLSKIKFTYNGPAGRIKMAF